ncbi:MAG: EF-hand domain-containing protein [Pseudomonadales bacterium]|nr:EF-hand domain-containing protein [Pseudomonadales bacterium]
MKPILTIALTTALLGAGAAYADRDGFRQHIIDKLDTDGDGQISLSEFRPPRDRSPMADADTNGDGGVSLDELQAHMAARMAEREAERAERRAEHAERLQANFREMDGNGDGLVTEDEARDSMFSHMDSNGDGYLTADEMRRPDRDPHARGGFRKHGYGRPGDDD